jgi:hypothetical protein
MAKERVANPGREDTDVFRPAATFHETVTLSFVIPSEAEGSAVLRTFPGNVFSTEPSGNRRLSCTS